MLNISKECMVFLSSSIVTFFCRNEIGELSNKCAIKNYKLYDGKKQKPCKLLKTTTLGCFFNAWSQRKCSHHIWPRQLLCVQEAPSRSSI